MAEIFDHEAFSLASLTTGYNSATSIDADVLNMFTVENVENRTVMIVTSGTELQVLMPGEIGNNPNIDVADAENAAPVQLIRYPFETNIVPSDLTRIASLKDKTFKATELAVLVKAQMTKHKGNHRYTAAYTAYSALKGKVRNKKGTVIVDLFQVLGVNERKVDLKLGTAGTDVPALLKKVKTETKAQAKKHGHMTMSGVTCRLGQDVIERILNHDSIKFADDSSEINICGINFVTDEADAVETKGASYPTGVNNLFGMLRAPADVMSGGANQRECYITKKMKDHDEGMEIRSRAIYLPICRDPSLLCEIFSSN